MSITTHPPCHLIIRRFINQSIHPYSHLSKHPSCFSNIRPYSQPSAQPCIHPSSQPAINQTKILSRHSSYNSSISYLSSYPSFDQFITQPFICPASNPYFFPTLYPIGHQAIQPVIQLAIYRPSVYPAFHRLN